MTHKFLFVDDNDIISMHGVERVIHPAKKHEGNPVVFPDKPWEEGVIVGTARKEGNLYRMWYQGAKEGPMLNLYAESKDGIHWEKPLQRRYGDFTGSLENNIYLNRLSFRKDTLAPVHVNQDHNQNVLYTPHMGKGRKYTMLSYDYGRSGYSAYDGYFLAFSKDGLEWTDGPQKPVIPGHADVGWFMFDEEEEKFRGIVKTFLNIRGHNRRSVLWTESNDGLNWLMPYPALIPDIEDERWTDGDENYEEDGRWHERFKKYHTQFYGMPIFRYESMLLGFLQVFKCTDEGSSDGTIDVQLASSRDGRNWQRVGSRRPVLERGGEDSWDWGCVLTGNSLIIEKDKVRVYYTAHNWRHGGHAPGNKPKRVAIGMAEWKKDRFAGLRAGSPGGEIKVASAVSGRDLHINADAKGGSIAVELAAENGKPIKGFEAKNCLPLCKDTPDHIISWQNRPSLSKIDGKKIRITVKLTDAEIFSVWWK